MAVSYIGASTPTTTIAAQTLTPHASTVDDDLLVFFHYANADTGTEAASISGWTSIFTQIASTSLLVASWHFRASGETTYTSTVTNHTTGVSGDSMLEWLATFRGVDTTTPIGSITATNSTWASSLNIGPITAPAATALADGNAVVVFGGRIENVTGQTTLTGDNLTWAQTGTGDTATGRDAGAVAQVGINASGVSQTITAKTVTTTGTAQIGAGRMFILNAAPPPPPPTGPPIVSMAPPFN